MKKFVTMALVGALVLGASSVVYANVCAFDPVPAATLLFPFVAFDYNNPISGTTTLFAVTNVSSEAEIVHVTLWTDYSIAVFDYNIILSGYDVQTVNIRDHLYFGLLPRTGTTGDLLVAPNDDPLADGPVSPPDYGWPFLDSAEGTNVIQAGAWPAARCKPGDMDRYPGYPDYPQIPQAALDLLKGWLQYSQTFDNLHDATCLDVGVGAPIGDWFELRNEADPTWMYITMDVVWQCNKYFPDVDLAYWLVNSADPDLNVYPFMLNSTDGQKRVRNVLMGDVFWLNDAVNFSEAAHPVHIEAEPFLYNVATVPPPPDDGFPVSFYYRYAVNLRESFFLTPVSDYREPLPTAWATRYIGWHDDAFDTWIRAFKAATNVPDNHPQAGAAGRPPTWVTDLWYDEGDNELIARDCLAYTYFAWDEDENVGFGVQDPWSFPGVDIYKPNLLPLETQEVSIDQFNVPSSFSGWILFVWPASNWADPASAWWGAGVNADWYQTWMGVKYAAYGQYSAAMDMLVMANFNCFADQVYPGLGANYPYVDPNTVVPTAHAGDYRYSYWY